MTLLKITAEEWKPISRDVHAVVFGKEKPDYFDSALDFVLAAETSAKDPIGYLACQDRGSGTLYVQYGGIFPDHRVTPSVLKGFQEALDYCKVEYKRVTMLVENTNKPMIRLAMKAGFLIVGTRTFGGIVYLDHLLEF